MTDEIGLDIPVYRRTEEACTRARESYLRQQWKLSPISGQIYEAWFEQYGRLFGHRPWRYNQIVAFLRLFLEGNHVKVHAWTRISRQTNRYSKDHPFVDSGSVAEAMFSSPNNATISAAALRALSMADSWAETKGWFPDYDRCLVESIDFERWLTLRHASHG